MTLSYYQEIDSVLGSRNTRYFGAGYLNSQRQITDFHVLTSDPELSFTCRGAVFIPNIWSQKKEGDLKPHLSTIDVLEFSVSCLAEVIRRTLNTNIIPDELIKKIRITAGKIPVENDLENIPISGQLKKKSWVENLLIIQIANMEIEIHFSSSAFISFRNNDHLTYYHQPITIEDVSINASELTAAALIHSMESTTNEIWSISNCFSVSLQLGQTLLYALDNINRDESNTLWMKRTEINFFNQRPSVNPPQPLYVRLDNTRKYTKADGNWRRADIYSIVCSTNIICSVTHRLPNSANKRN